jgi:AcrR family transcriptional regulator
MAEVIAEEGYPETTVHKVLQRARISRRTYYELFKDKEDCFLVAYDEAIEHLVKLIHGACEAAEGDPARRIEAGLQAGLEFCEREPKIASMCVVEVMAAGPRARERRTQTMEQITRLVADALSERCDSRSEAVLLARVLIGGVHEMVYDALSRGRVRGLTDLAEEVVSAHVKPFEAAHGR